MAAVDGRRVAGSLEEQAVGEGAGERGVAAGVVPVARCGGLGPNAYVEQEGEEEKGETGHAERRLVMPVTMPTMAKRSMITPITLLMRYIERRLKCALTLSMK